MAIIWMEGFDNYGTTGSSTTVVGNNLALKYPTTGGTGHTLVTGRQGGLAYTAGGGDYITTPFFVPDTTMIIGMALRKNGSGATNPILFVLDGLGNEQQRIYWNGANQLIVARNAGGTTLLTGATPFINNTWYYVEIKIVCDASAGSVQIKLNGVNDGTVTGIQTRTQSNNNIQCVQFNAGSFSHYKDDIYILNSDSSGPNTFLGDVQIVSITPSGAGTHTDFTPSAGANYQNVDDVAYDDDTTYNETSVTGNIDTYAMSDISLSGAIKGVQFNWVSRKTTAGTRLEAPVIRTNSTDTVGSDVSETDTYTNKFAIYQKNPVTSADFTQSELNAAEFGIKVTN